MLIYNGDINGKATILLLKLGKPVMLNHIQMAKLRQNVFPHALHAIWEKQTRLPKKFLKLFLGD